MLTAMQGMNAKDCGTIIEAGDHRSDTWIDLAARHHFRLGLDLSADTVWFDPA